MSSNKPVRARAAHPNHFVRFYPDDAFLCEAASRFFEAGLRRGELLVAIVTPAHRSGICDALRFRGLCLEAAVRSGQIRWIDAQRTLSLFMRDGAADGNLFVDEMSLILEDCRGGRPYLPMRAFGEMVDILLAQENPDAALQVERLWNQLADRHDFSLLCAYETRNLQNEKHWEFFKNLCLEHSISLEQTSQPESGWDLRGRRPA